MPAPPDPLVAPSELTRFNVPGDFLAQFRWRPFQVQIMVGGALGAMAYAWRLVGDQDWSATIYSSAGATWSDPIDDAFATLTFATVAYALGTIYTVDASGNVTGGAGEVTAELLDLVGQACASVTREALGRMADAITQPVLTWTDDWRQHAANMVYAALKRGRGATPKGAGVGDDHVFLAEDAARLYFDMIGKRGKPEGIVDSSTLSDGPMFASYPTSDPPRGW